MSKERLNTYLRFIAGTTAEQQDWNIVSEDLLRVGYTLYQYSMKEGSTFAFIELLRRNDSSLGICNSLDEEYVNIVNVDNTSKLVILTDSNAKTAHKINDVGNQAKLSNLQLEVLPVDFNLYRVYYYISACILGRYDRDDILSRSSLQLLVYCGLSADARIYLGGLSQILLYYSLAIHPQTEMQVILSHLGIVPSSILSKFHSYFTEHKIIFHNIIEDSVARCLIVLTSSGTPARICEQLRPMFQLRVEDMKSNSSSWDEITLFNKLLSITLATLSCITSCRSEEDKDFSETKVWISLKNISL